MRKMIILAELILFLLFNNIAIAAMYGGVDFPQGESSFADEVISYTPGPNVNTFSYGGDIINPMLPDFSLGTPDEWEQVPGSDLFLPTNPGGGCVSLGDGGELVLKFTNNSLTTSNDDSYDLWIFEVGYDEPAEVSISSDGINWVDIGLAAGG